MSKGSTAAINDKILSSFRPTKDFDYHQKASVTSLDFDDSGHYLISAGVDKSIQLYDVHKGSHYKDIQSQKYGAHLARFTHHELDCLYALTPTESAEIDHAIRYLSLASKLYIRYFKGHKGLVTSIEVNPVSDIFLSSSLDRTVKLWDLKSSSPAGSIDLASSLVAFDPQGMVFAVVKEYSLLLFDLKNYDKSPFLEIPLPDTHPLQKIEFSNNGKFILVSSNINKNYIIDAFLGQLLTTLLVDEFEPINYKYPTTGSSTFSPCGKFVLAGSPNNKISLFDLKRIKSTDGDSHVVLLEDNDEFLQPFKLLNTLSLPKIIAFNPKLFTFATADNTVSLWQPSRLA